MLGGVGSGTVGAAGGGAVLSSVPPAPFEPEVRVFCSGFSLAEIRVVYP
jgi:hypothetical protein